MTLAELDLGDGARLRLIRNGNQIILERGNVHGQRWRAASAVVFPDHLTEIIIGALQRTLNPVPEDKPPWCD